MNRAHAYKASVDQNEAKGVEPDDGVTMGLFSYPVLMAADILMFNAHRCRWAATRSSIWKWRATSRSASTISTVATISRCPR